MIRGLFWAATTTLVYTYVVFPVLILVRGWLRPRRHREADITPPVTVIIAAHNEAGTIGRKLETVIEQDYPPDRLQVVVASDGSTDATIQAATAVAGRRPDASDPDTPTVTVLDLPRVGKAAALEAAVSAARSDILVFSDANSMFRRDALRNLVRAFDDPNVGGVAGNQVYTRDGSDEAIAVGERSYWDFDRLLKQAASRAGNAIAGTGALYGIRRSAFRTIPPGVNDDFYLSLAVIDAGYRLVFEPNAIAYEAVAPSRQMAYGRRVRIMTRGLLCLARVPGVLDPRKTGFYALHVFSHKILMRVMAVPLSIAAGAGLLLYRRGPVYRLATWTQATFYALAAAGLALEGKRVGHRPVFALPAYFCVLQAASLQATWNLLRGRTYERWETARQPSEASPGDAIEGDRQ